MQARMDGRDGANAKSTTTSPAPAATTSGQDIEREIERKIDDGTMAGRGWQQLPEEKKMAGSNPGEGRDSAEVVTIELGETGLSNSTSNAGILKGVVALGGTTDPGEGNTRVAPPEGYKVYKRRWFGLVQLVLLNIIVSWDWLTFSPVASHAARYFNVDETTVNWMSTAFMFAFAFIAPVVIYVLHLGPKLSIMTAASLVLVGNWIRYGGSHSPSGGTFGVVMFGQILTGLAQPFVLAAPTRYSDLWFTNRGRVAATAITSLANPFGAALGQLIVPFWVKQPSDVSSMVLYVSAIATACSLPAFFVPAKPPTPVAPSSETPKLSLRSSIRELLPHLEFWLLLIPFAVYVGSFNAVSSLLNQIMAPYGYSEEESGIAGAILIVVGLVTAAATSPIIDRTKAFLTTVRIAVPLVGLSLLAFVWMPETKSSGGVAGPYVVMAILGAASFSLVPVAIEFMVEVTHPISPEVTSTLAWSGGQLLGGVFVIISGALKDGPDADPPNNMRRALIFSAVIAMLVVPVPLCLGLFGRKDNIRLRRVGSDELVAREREGIL